MKVDDNKDRGRTGLSLAIGYYGSNGYTVSLPLNDTQDYDLIIDDGKKLQKVQVKYTGQFSCYSVYQANIKSCGGTKGAVYKKVKDTEIDLLFIVCSNGEMYEIPKHEITQDYTINLGLDMTKYKVSFEFINPQINVLKKKQRLQLTKTNVCIDCGKSISKKAERCKECNNKYLKKLQQKKSKIPSEIELSNKLKECSNLTVLRKVYNVSDMTIRHWLKNYNLPYKAEEVKKFKESFIV